VIIFCNGIYFELGYKVQQKEHLKIGLLGASFDTGNLGVSALAESCLKVILNRWPDADIILVGIGYEPRQHHLFLMEKEICVRTLPIRFSKNIFLPYHFLWFAFYSLIMRILPASRLKQNLANCNSCFKTLYDIDLVADITGGDSFSDIYGFKRFFLGFLCKWLVTFLGKRLVLLPQTYGPFKGRATRLMARYVFSHASMVYSRDKSGIEYITKLSRDLAKNGKVGFAPDVAFVLDSRKPENINVDVLKNKPAKDSVLVGLNISGLLFNGGYTRDNMFGLKTDYPELVYRIIDSVLADKKSVVLLVPHVFHPPGHVESDSEACAKVYEAISSKYRGRIFQVSGSYNQNEIKYVIGKCDFFIGSRMHSCIAALSQNIPAVGLAYSKKFHGVFHSISVADLVVDMREKDPEEIVDAVAKALMQRDAVAAHLKDAVPDAQQRVLGIFDNVVLN
jgi:colanic acid/amylovoran biosynthesis protein